MVLLERAAVGLLASGAVALVAYRRGSLSMSGAWTGLLVGVCVFLGGDGAWFAALLTFFVTSSALGRVGSKRKEATKRDFSKSDTRDSLQVLANGGVATAAAVAHGLWPHPELAAAFLGALATATGDTWATELGTLARTRPWSIRTLRPVPAGTSGAISGAGLLATLGGACLIGLVAALSPASYGLSPWVALAAAGAGGFCGAMADSWLGAVVQARFRCPHCQVDTEGALHHCGHATELTGGARSFGNDSVNAAATLVGSGAAVLLARLL